MLYNISKYKTNTWKSTNPLNSAPLPHTHISILLKQSIQCFHYPSSYSLPTQAHHSGGRTEAQKGPMLLPGCHALPIESDHTQMSTCVYSSCLNGIHGSIPKDTDKYCFLFKA